MKQTNETYIEGHKEYKRKTQLLRYIYCLKDISNLNLMMVFSIVVDIFNTLQIFMRVYL